MLCKNRVLILQSENVFMIPFIRSQFNLLQSSILLTMGRTLRFVLNLVTPRSSIFKLKDRFEITQFDSRINRVPNLPNDIIALPPYL